MFRPNTVKVRGCFGGYFDVYFDAYASWRIMRILYGRRANVSYDNNHILTMEVICTVVFPQRIYTRF